MEYLGHLVSGQGISPLRQKIKAVSDLACTTNITVTWHMLGLIGYYRKYFPVFSDMIRPLNELTKKNISFKWMENVKNLGLCQASHHYKPHLSLHRPK